MRILIVIFLLPFISCSRFTGLDGTYYSKQQDCLVLDGKTGIIENKDKHIANNLDLKQRNEKLKFRRITISTRKLIFRRTVYKYKFKIHYKTDDSFMISPSSKLAKKYFDNRDSIVFKTKYQFADRENSFTKIVYHSSRCFGFCNDLHLELDYSGNLKVSNYGNGRSGSQDSARNDHYVGKVSYEDLDRLKDVIKYAQLKTLEWPESRRCYDFPDLTLILYQNDKRYYFKMNAACIPIVSHQLTGFLGRFFSYETLKKTDTIHTYER